MTEADAHRQTPAPAPAAGRVVTIDADRDARWAALIGSRPEAIVYQHPAWLGVLGRTYGYRSTCLAVEDAAGALHGVLALLATRGLVTGRRLSCLPHTPVCGPLADAPDVAAQLMRGAVDLARADGRRLLIKASSPGLAGDGAGPACVPADDTYVLELPERPEDLRFGSSRNHARIRWAVRKAERNGVAVREADTCDDLRAWYRLYLETMRWHAVPPRPYRLFAAMWDLLRPAGMMQLLLVEQRSAGRRRLLAGSVILRCGPTATYAFNGRRRDALALRPNDVLQWTAIPRLCAAGVRSYDLGEVGAEQAGLADFKSKWGARPQPLYRYHHPPAAGRRAGALGAGGRLRRVAEAGWRRLPVPATAPVGDWLYRHA